MEEITIAEFVDGYEKGYITDVIAIGNKVYGKDPRGMADEPEPFKVVWATIP